MGVNCSAGPETMVPVSERMAAVAEIPVIAKPNAGLPALSADGKTVYDMDAESFGEYAKDVGMSLMNEKILDIKSLKQSKLTIRRLKNFSVKN